jgi:hypothetical protein
MKVTKLKIHLSVENLEHIKDENTYKDKLSRMVPKSHTHGFWVWQHTPCLKHNMKIRKRTITSNTGRS